MGISKIPTWVGSQGLAVPCRGPGKQTLPSRKGCPFLLETGPHGGKGTTAALEDEIHKTGGGADTVRCNRQCPGLAGPRSHVPVH